MNLALVGYGRMGRMVEQLAPEFGFDVKLRLDIENNTNQAGMTQENFQGIDAAIEFSVPDAVVGNVERLCRLGVNTVIGTTGWQDQLEHVKSMVHECGTGLIWSPNYSIGVNVFARAVAETARLMKDQDVYGAWAWEIHHSKKLDAPSGTLLKLVDEMRRAGFDHPIDISSNRAGAHPGTHEIGFDSADDTITLRHAARSRTGFARGALKAAQWIAGNKGFYEFSEILFGQGR
jgi:4-hydroxy-tetrahydrodipicolinate reductase